jgi:TolB-like protein/DNA-binding winged helix-turn-helix (wHTH) protein
MDALISSDIVLFGQFRFDRCRGLLFRRGEDDRYLPVGIGSRALEVLSALTARPGDLVTKDEIMRAAWAGAVVEEGNLTVQISTLRRVLDAGSEGGSCIQTVSGRGYRFVQAVTRPEESRLGSHPSPVDPIEASAARTAARRRAWSWPWLAVGSGAIVILALMVTALWFGSRPAGALVPPRLSLVVLPFENLSGDPKDDYLADGITDDLTGDLSHIDGASVIARESAYTFKGKAADVRQIGAALGVRYLIEGSVRRIEDTLRVNVQLTSAETGVHLWSDRFDERIADLKAGQEQIVMRMRDELGNRLVEIEAARSLRERPSSPDAFDLVLRARAIRNLPPAPERDEQVLALLEQALALDPRSIYAMTHIVFYDAGDAIDNGWGTFGRLRRAERLISEARSLAPGSELVLNTYVIWLRAVDRCPEAIEAAERAIQTDPNRTRVQTGLYNELARCKMKLGDAAAAISLHEQADRLNPRSTFRFQRYAQIGLALLLLGRDREAVAYLEHSFVIHPLDSAGVRYRRLAAAYALMGQEAQARHALAEADQRWPYDTVRSNFANSPSSVYARQMRHIQDGLRLAGERDHADEDADFGLPADRALHSEKAGHTPTSAPGATTIRTSELARLLAEVRPLVIDVVECSCGASVPDAVGLKFAGLGGSFTDEAQDRLRVKLHDLTSGDRNRPIVATGWNSERFDGRNLALRLVALGYTRVYWYRGGREAWEVAGLPETELDAQQW